MMSRAIISSRAIHRKRSCGYTGSATHMQAGSCTASLPSGAVLTSTDALPGYAELHCLTNFTFLRGASHPEELAERAHELGYSALAITDECSVAGIVRAHIAAKDYGLKLIIGTEVKLE